MSLPTAVVWSINEHVVLKLNVKLDKTFLALRISCLFVASVIGFLNSSSALTRRCGVDEHCCEGRNVDEFTLAMVEFISLVGVKSISIGYDDWRCGLVD